MNRLSGFKPIFDRPFLVPVEELCNHFAPSARTDHSESIRSETYPSCCISCAALQFSLEFPLAVSTLTTPIVPILVERCPTSPPPTSTQWHLALTTYHAGIWRCPLNRRARLNFPGTPHQISLTPLITPLRQRGSGPIARSVASSHAQTPPLDLRNTKNRCSDGTNVFLMRLVPTPQYVLRHETSIHT